MDTALLGVEVVIYEFDLLHGKSFYFSKSPVNSNVEDVEPVSSGLVFVDVLFWIIYDREKKSEVWGVVNSLLRKRGSVHVDPVGCFPMSSSAMSSMALIIVESRVIRYQ